MQLQAPRGTYDALPAQSARMRHIEQTALRVFATFGYGEIRTPMFEAADLFRRTSGETSDVVSKEMYDFTDRSGDVMCLRPEGTAPVARAYYSNGLKQHLPLKVCYAGAPMFRYERPQKGRFRQHHQVGIECLGYASAWADVEVITTGFALLRELGIDEGLYVQLNTLGTPHDRATYREKLVAYLERYKGELSADSKTRLHKNPLRILDSKDAGDRKIIANAPLLKDWLSRESQAFYATVQEGLTANSIRFQHNDMLVRGLDYYTHTVFEIHSDALGAQSQVISGGRYDGLFAQIGKDDVPAVGFGCGVERLEALFNPSWQGQAEQKIAVVNACGQLGMVYLLPLVNALRAAGWQVDVPLSETPPTFKNQLKKADKSGAVFVLILGEDELAQGKLQLKNMHSGRQQLVTPQALPDVLKQEQSVA